MATKPPSGRVTARLPGGEVSRPNRLAGRVLAARSDRPLARYRVQGYLLEDGKGSRGVDLGYDLTDHTGRFALDLPGRASADKSVRLTLHVRRPEGEEVHRTTLEWQPGREEPVTLRVPDPDDGKPAAPSLRELAEATALELPGDLLGALQQRGIGTLADVRRGLGRVQGLPAAPDHPAVAALDAHARLSLLSPDVRVSARLLERGYASPASIAATPRAEFVGAMQAAVGSARAYQLHGAAEAQTEFLDNLAAGATVMVAEGRTAGLDGLDLEPMKPLWCHCRDCEAAMSPLAYLADLLDYARQRLRENGAVSVDALAQRFYQPFGRLPAACGALDESVRQVRVCIEVLRAYLADHPPTVRRQAALTAAERDYRSRAYLRLLSEIGTSYDALRLALAAAGPEPRERLAQRIGVPTNRLGSFALGPGAVTEADLERVFGLRRTTRDPLDAVPTSLLEQRRLEYLGQIWQAEDWPDDLPPAGQPCIDPDVIGPDDFRAPVGKANAADPDRAFDLWLRRRRWIDDRLGELLNPAHPPQRVVRGQPGPDYLAAMLAAMYGPVTYAAVQRQPWDNAVAVGALDGLANDLARGSAARIDQVRTLLRDALGTSVEAFARLQELRAKDRRFTQQAGSDPLSDDDRRELASLLVQSMKARFVDLWRDEETQAQVQLGPAEFWLPEREPTDGEWPPSRPQPLIDPELVGIKELPGWLAGARALSMWRLRRDQLATIHADLRTTRENQGLAAALAQALGDPANPLPDLVALSAGLNDPDPAVSGPARRVVEDRLFMSVEAFGRLMEIRARDAAANNPAGPNPPSLPTDADWTEVDAVLTSAQKRFRLYPAWRAVETDPHAPLPYWLALATRLERWRADATVRAQWQNALRVRSERPLIDPDVIGPGDFTRPYAGQAAYDLFRAREAELRGFQDGLRAVRAAAANPLAGLDAMCRQALGHPSQVVLDFDAFEREGYAIAPRLAQLGLARGDYDRLLRARGLIDANVAVLADHWSEIEAALTKAAKRRLTGRWRDQERQAGITLRPELFRRVDEDPVPPADLPPGSRHEPTARRTWRERLAARVEQREGVRAALATLRGAVEEALLPILRDALILAADVPGTEVEGKGKTLADRLLIDTRNGGCQVTTRVSQAITTLQLLLWSIRTGQLRDTYPNLTLDDDRFDERWRWIGSYATWRAAMFVHLYPENVLMPALRRARTPGFDGFLGEVRQGRRRINPDNACQFASAYAGYYRDVTSLEVQASCHARTNLSSGGCGARAQGGERVLTYWFARAAASGRGYWSTHDPADPSSQSLWAPIPGFDRVVAVLGAVPFIDRDGVQMILVFAKTRKEDADQLLMARYGLSAPGWRETPVELDGPPDVEEFHAVVNQHRIWTYGASPQGSVPLVIFQVAGGSGNRLFEKRLDATGKQWSDNRWDLLDEWPYYRSVLGAVPTRAYETEPYYLFFQDYGYGGTLLYKIYHAAEFPQLTYFDGTPASQGAPAAASGRFLRAILWPYGDEVFVFWKPGPAGGAVQVLRLTPPQALPLDPVADLAAFNQWLFYTAGVSLESITVSLDIMALSGASNLFAFLTLPGDNPLRANLGDAVYRAFASLQIGAFQAYVEGRAMIPSSDAARATLATWQLADRIVRANTQPSLGMADCARRLFERRFPGAPAAPLALRRLAPAGVASHPSLAGIDSVASDAGTPDAPPLEVGLALSRTGQDGIDVLRGVFFVDPGTNELAVRDLSRIVPHEVVGVPPLAAAEAGTPPADRRAHVQGRYLEHLADRSPNLVYLDEYYYLVPLQLALELQRNGHYLAALDWFRTVYDYEEPPGPSRKIWYWLVHEETLPNVFDRLADWLLDPLNPHAIAQTRLDTYSRFTLLSLIRCFLAYADDEFTRDTVESTDRARVLYQSALELLDAPELQQQLDGCGELIGTLEVRLADPSRQSPWQGVIDDLGRLQDSLTVNRTVAAVRAAMDDPADDDTRLAKARAVVDDALAAQPPRPTFGELIGRRSRTAAAVADALVAHDAVAAAVTAVGQRVAGDRLAALSLVTGTAAGELLAAGTDIAWLRDPVAGNGGNGASRDRLLRTTVLDFPFSPRFAYQFCVPPNPLVTALRWHAALNLHKLRNCLNIAGMSRQVEPYAAATDRTTGPPMIGTSGQLSLPGVVTLRPTPYRYEALLGRARELVQLAAQIEASMLHAIEQRDAELYQQLKARQDISLTRAGVRLQDLRVREAEGAVELAELQRDRAQFQVEHFAGLLEEGLLGLESAALGFMVATAALHVVASGFHVAAAAAELAGMPSFAGHFSQVAATFAELAAASSTVASILSTLASYERRRQEWEYDRDVAQFDVRIGSQQVRIARDQLQVVGQERDIARLQADHADETAEFLRTKFTNAELYDWMSNVLEGVYSFFLQQATATAKLALAQVAFERQEVPPPFIQDDYWEARGEGSVTETDGGNAPERRGLTGSARLLRDLQQLDQFAFDTRQRKQELSQTLSLARLFPIEFARFRQTGVFTFATPMELFDRAFPGHYLRQVRRVKVSVIALVPLVTGIRATLASSRISRIVVGPEIFQTVRIERGPEQIALTSPRDSAGVLELEPQSELLRPFEGIGVDTIWELRMPRAANQFDYGTIADVLMTVEYTALASFDYREQVTRALPPTLSADRPFSFRHEFADQWYDLHNPELTATPLTVRFSTERTDFPPNLDDLSIGQVALFFSRANGGAFEVELEHLRFTTTGATGYLGGGATTIDGIVSTRRNAPSWTPMRGKAPFGEWELALPNTATMRSRFKQEEIEDILFVVTYSGRTPAWPA